MTTVNGQEEPVPYCCVASVDVIKCFLILYTGLNGVSLFFCLILIALKPGECNDTIKNWTYTMLVFFCLNIVFSLFMSITLAIFKCRAQPQLYDWHIALGRINVNTRSTNSKWIFYSIYAQDFITILVIIVGWTLFNDADSCNLMGFKVFYITTMIF